MLLKNKTVGEWKSQRQSEKYIREMKMEIPFKNLWDTAQKTSQSDHMDHILSDLSTMTRTSWVAPLGMA